jgi:hypothetical protein
VKDVVRREEGDDIDRKFSLKVVPEDHVGILDHLERFSICVFGKELADDYDKIDALYHIFQQF